jgi:sarcosine oxidase subunit gamma
MPERYQWQGGLAALGIEARALGGAAQGGITLAERRVGTQLAIRGDAGKQPFSSAVARVLGVELPVTPKTAHGNGDTALLWLGPDEWLAVRAGAFDAELADGLVEALTEALAGVHHAVVDVSHSRVVIALDGPRAREVLMKGTNIDLHPRKFGAGSCIQGHLGRCHMLLHQIDDDPRYDIYIHRSFAVYAWNWLCDAGAEYGLVVRGAAGR